MRTSALLCLLGLAAAGQTEVIDRVAVTVDRQVITASAVREELRLAAWLNGEQPDLGAEARRRAAGRLVERLLLEREMELTRFPAPPPEEAAQLLSQARRGSPEPQFQQALAAYELTPAMLEAYLRRQAALLRFLEVRFRPEAQVSEADLEACAARRAAQTPAALEEARARCAEELTASAVDQAVDRWLRDARGRARIEYREEAFQ